MKSAKNIEKLIRKTNVTPSARMDQKTLDDILDAQEKTQKISSADIKPNTWRLIMKNRMMKFAAAAVIIIAAILTVSIFNKTIPTASAAEVLSQAVKAVSNLHSVYIKARMRTIAHDNFALIGPDYDFVPVEMWKEFDGTEFGKCRYEKPERVLISNNKSSLMLTKSKYASRGPGGGSHGSVHFLRCLMDVDKVLDAEINSAQSQDSELFLTHEKTPDGDKKLVVIVDALAKGDFTNDYLKNTSVSASDNRRIYRFDPETKLLENLQVFIYPDDTNEILVFEIADIQYNVEIEPEVFTIELPDDVIWYERPEPLPNSEKYAEMSPKEVAYAFFQAWADEDWEELLKLWPHSRVSDELKQHMGGLKIISIGEPFKSGLYPGWFVPYKIKFKNGRVKKMNLAVRNDNPAKCYIVDGGF